MKRIYILLLQSFFILGTLTATTSAGITVYDDAVSVNKSVKLVAITKGRFFPAGGKLVKYYVDEKHIGTNLSGGDGYAFITYVPSSRGIKKLKVESGGERDEGVLLITDKNDRVLLIAIEDSLFKSLLSFKPLKEGSEAIQQLAKDFRIIYLTTLMGINQSRKWLKDNGLPLLPVLKWEGAEIIAVLQEQGVPLHAIIGSPEILAEASDINKRFSFEETEDGTEVKDWEDLIKQLE